jgi:hypothetical protein
MWWHVAFTTHIAHGCPFFLWGFVAPCASVPHEFYWHACCFELVPKNRKESYRAYRTSIWCGLRVGRGSAIVKGCSGRGGGNLERELLEVQSGAYAYVSSRLYPRYQMLSPSIHVQRTIAEELHSCVWSVPGSRTADLHHLLWQLFAHFVRTQQKK